MSNGERREPRPITVDVPHVLTPSGTAKYMPIKITGQRYVPRLIPLEERKR